MPRLSSSSPASVDAIPPKRGRGRPPKASAIGALPVAVVTMRQFVGYCLSGDPGSFSLCQEYEERKGSQTSNKTVDTHIRIPESIQEKLSDEAFQQEFVGYTTRIRQELNHRDNHKLHLQKDAPDHVYFSYSIDGAPTTHFFIHPSRVDVAAGAFENGSEHTSFHEAVANQNFSNKAYKKWRDGVRDQFLDDIISFELVKKFGTEAERKESHTSQSAAMHGHNGAKKIAPVIVRPHVAAVVEPPKKKIEEPVVAKEEPKEIEKEESQAPTEDTSPRMPTTSDKPTVTVQGGQGTIQTATPPPDMWTPMITRPRITVASAPSRPKITAVQGPEELPEYIEAKKAYLAAAQSLKPFAGVVGAFRKEFQHDEYVKQFKLYRETKERYEHARRNYLVFIMTRHIATLLGAVRLSVPTERTYSSLAFWVFQGQEVFSKTRIGYFLTDEKYKQYEQGLEKDDDNPDMQLELRALLNAVTLEGFTMAALLGVVVGRIGDSDPSQTVRIAAAASMDLPALRERLRSSFGIEACRVPEMTFTQRRTLADMTDLSHMRDIVTMLEFHARLRGEVLSMERHHTTYCDLYTQLYEKYYSVVTRPEGVISVQEALGDEKASIALTESLLRQGKTIKEYASVKPEGMKFLASVSKDKYPSNLHDLARVFSLTRWQGTDLGSRAQTVWKTWHSHNGIEKSGMVYLELEPSETLLGALRRALFTYEDLLSDIQGEGEQKVYTLLRQLYTTMDFTGLPANPQDWLRLGNVGDRVYFDATGQPLYVNSSGMEPGFLDMDEFEGFIKGTPEYVLCQMIHNEGEEDFLEYIKDFPEVFLNYYEKKIDVLSVVTRAELQSQLEGLNTQDHDTREEAESFFRAFYTRHHEDPITKVS